MQNHLHYIVLIKNGLVVDQANDYVSRDIECDMSFHFASNLQPSVRTNAA